MKSIQNLRIVFMVALVVLAACEVPSASEPELATAPSKEEVTFVVVEQMPAPVGGLQAIMERIQYPEAAKTAGVEGKVFIEFVVDEQGRVVDPTVLRGIGSGCDEAALQAVANTTFEPGRQKGEAVRVKMTIPVSFKLS